MSRHKRPDTKKYAFFSHKECEYFPCHKTDDPESFNCLFCYCPLYILGRNCGGNFYYDGNGRKVCTNCLRPHLKENYGEIIGQYGKIQDAVAREDERNQ